VKAELVLFNFLKASSEDGRIGPGHISLYLTLVKCWKEKDFEDSFPINRDQVMIQARISGRATYQKYILDLFRYGYIGYEPSRNHFLGSKVSLEKFPKFIE
jgi:hypothetical protein